MDKITNFVLNLICKEEGRNLFEPKEMIIYQKWIEKVPDGSTIVECGNYMGKSICSISAKIKQKKLKVYCIDIDHLPEFKKNLKKYEIEDFVTLITKDSIEALKSLKDKSISLFFLDDDPSYEHVKEECLICYNKLTNDGILSGHDFNNPNIGVTKAVTDLFHKDDIDDDGLMWIINKPISKIKLKTSENRC